MIIIKCRYKYCKNNNEVSKEEAIKEGTSYYCKDCYNEKTIKQQIEQFYSVNMPSTAIQLLRKVINQLLYTNNYKVEYILFVLKKIHVNKLKISNPFGLINYCNDGKNIDEWNRQVVSKEFKNIKDNIIKTITNENEVKFTYKLNNKKWTDLI